MGKTVAAVVCISSFAGALLVLLSRPTTEAKRSSPSTTQPSEKSWDWSRWNERGRARAHRRDFQGALQDFDQAIALNPKSALLRNNRGGAMLAQGDLKGAMAEFSKALDLDPNYAEVRINRGQTKADLGDLDGAIKDYEEALAHAPDAWPFRGFVVWKLEATKRERVSRPATYY